MDNIPSELILKASSGDIQAFEDIYHRASGFVYSVALRVANNAGVAEDIVQEVFVKVYRSLRNFEFRSSFKTWLYRITVNCALDNCKRDSRQPSSVGEAIEMVADDDKTGERLAQQDRQKRLSDLLEKLNPDHRACIVLREIEGLSYQEMAQSLKIKINTVRTRLKRARQALLALAKNEVPYEL